MNMNDDIVWLHDYKTNKNTWFFIIITCVVINVVVQPFMLFIKRKVFQWMQLGVRMSPSSSPDVVVTTGSMQQDPSMISSSVIAISGVARRAVMMDTVRHLKARSTGPAFDVFLQALDGTPPALDLNGDSHDYEQMHIAAQHKLSPAIGIERVIELYKLGALYFTAPNCQGRPMLQRVNGELQKSSVVDALYPSGYVSTSIIEKGVYLRAYLHPKRYNVGSIKEKILYSDARMVIIDKIAGIPCHESVDNAVECAKTQAEIVLGCSLWTTGRLDIPTSGILLFAKDKDTCAYIHNLLASKQYNPPRGMLKRYRAKLRRQSGASLLPSSNTIITHWMKQSKRAPQLISSYFSSEQGFVYESSCILEDVEYFKVGVDDCAFITVKLLTGRTHQIRAQFGALGWPLYGDWMYGDIDNRDSDIDAQLGDEDTHDSGDKFCPNIHLRCINLQFSMNNEIFDFKVDDLAP